MACVWLAAMTNSVSHFAVGTFVKILQSLFFGFGFYVLRRLFSNGSIHMGANTGNRFSFIYENECVSARASHPYSQ